jgi:HD superfamily phosphodiesterase
MEIVSKALVEYGMTGVFILVLIFAVSKMYNQSAELRKWYEDEVVKREQSKERKEKENNELEREFRSYLMHTQSELTKIIKENTEAFKEFSKNLIILKEYRK